MLTALRQKAAYRAARAARRIGGDVGAVGELGGIWNIPPDCDPPTAQIIRSVQAFTLTPPARIMALCDAVRHIARSGVPGAIVECGVWRGGSMMAAALTLLEQNAADRELHLFDTFTEMPPPGEFDGHVSGADMRDLYDRTKADPLYDNYPMTRVREVLESTGYPPDQLNFAPGMVEETIPDAAPEGIALCRLDTDFYESTAHEMKHLYGRIAPGGVLIVDDYGDFQGARKAVDEHFATLPHPPLLHRVDASCRLAIVS